MNFLNTAQTFGKAPRRPSKYRSKRTQNADGTWSDSRKEAGLDVVFMAMKNNPDVLDVERKKKFKIEVNGQLICYYECDWCVTYRNWKKIEIWDAKGFKTREYLLKKKLMKAVYGLEINEC